jgi:hypothetical protein
VDASRGKTRMNERLVAGFASAQVLEHRSRGVWSSVGHPLAVGIVDTSSKATRRYFAVLDGEDVNRPIRRLQGVAVGRQRLLGWQA